MPKEPDRPDQRHEVPLPTPAELAELEARANGADVPRLAATVRLRLEVLDQLDVPPEFQPLLEDASDRHALLEALGKASPTAPTAPAAALRAKHGLPPLE